MFTVIKIVSDGQTWYERVRTGEAANYAAQIGDLDAKVTAIAFGLNGEDSLRRVRELRASL